ncbi:MAG: fumarate hydratase [Oscillospiraceae bacterium]|nr:fumarate hydratase [Oscillospiraceae bacterium]
MREISAETIKNTVKMLFIDANHELGEDEKRAIENASKNEKSQVGQSILNALCENLKAAKELHIPICQDTGMAVVFIDVGQDVHITGGSYEDAINKGVAEAYTEGFMRASVVKDPIFCRENTKNNTPAVIHTRIVDGDKIKITALPKGFGSENMSALKMFNPSATREEIIDFVVETVKKAGSNPCPPIEVGIGIGGTFDYAPILAKNALARGINTENANPDYARLEKEILGRINDLGIGPQGFGGDTTALGVNIEYYPTHIAGLPVAVNINCHVMRHKCAII